MWLLLLKNWKWAAMGVLAAALAATYWVQDIRLRTLQAKGSQATAELSECRRAAMRSEETISMLRDETRRVRAMFDDLAASKTRVITKIRTIQTARGASDTQTPRISDSGSDELLSLLDGMYAAKPDSKDGVPGKAGPEAPAPAGPLPGPVAPPGWGLLPRP